MKLPHWQTIRDMHNAARDRRQATRELFALSAKKSALQCIDRSDPGAWADALQYAQFPVVEYDTFERDLDRRLALRRAARQEPNPHKRGWITRAINAGKL